MANTTGLFGRLGRTLAWRRAMTVTSGVLVVHLGVITASALSHVESAFTQVASSSNLSFWLLHTLGWHAGTTPAVGGAVVVLMALLVVVLATIGEWPVLRSLRSPRAAGPVVGLHAVATVPVVLFVVCIVCDVFIAILPRWLLSVQQTQASPNEWLASKLPWFAVLAIVVVAVGAAVILAVYRRSIDPAWSLPVAGALVAGLALLATVHSNEGWLPWALRWAGWGAAGTVAVLATVSLFFYAVIGARPPRRMALWSVPLTALLITIWMVPTGASVGWWQVQPLMVRLDGITGLAIVTAVVAALRRLGRRHPVRQQDLRASRVLGIGLAYIVIMIATPSLPLLLVGAIMAWVLFPRAAVARTEEILRQPDGRHAAAVRSIVRAGTARRTLVVLRKTTRDKVASGDWTPQRAQQLTEDIEHTAAEETPADTTGCAGLRDRAFGYSFTRRPSIRAGWTLRVAGILGAPWMILAVVGAAHKSVSPPTGLLFWPQSAPSRHTSFGGLGTVCCLVTSTRSCADAPA